MKKRAICLLLALLLAVSLLPMPALAAMPTGSVEINGTNFPDENFRSYLLDNTSYTTEGETKYYTATQLTWVSAINVCNKGIGTLKGIEFFTELRYLDCSRNQLTALNVSACTALAELNCRSNQLDSLNLKKNTALKTLVCFSNQLTALNVSGMTALTGL